MSAFLLNALPGTEAWGISIALKRAELELAARAQKHCIILALLVETSRVWKGVRKPRTQFGSTASASSEGEWGTP